MSFTLPRDARLVVGAKAVSWLGDEVALVALILKLQSGGAGAGAVAALLMANLTPIVLLSGVVGRLVDRRDNRRLLLASSLAQAGLCGLLAGVSGTAPTLALVALLGIGQAVNGATWQALLPAIVGREALPSALGRSQAATTVAGVLAPPIGGLLTGWFGTSVPLLVDAGSFLAVTAAATALRIRRGGRPAAAGRAGRSRGGLPIVWQDALLRPLFLLLAAFVLLASMVNVVEVFLVRETLHASPLWYGIAGASLSAGALGGALLSGRLRGVSALARGFVAAATLLSLGLALMGFVPDVAWLLPCGALVGAANGALNVTLSSLVMGRAGDDERGRVGALLTGLASGMQLAAFVVGGLLAATFTPREIFIAAGTLGLLAPAALGRRLVRAGAPEEPAPAAPAAPAAAAAGFVPAPLTGAKSAD